MTPSSLYYYADGKRVTLDVDSDHVALDLRAAVEHGLQAFVDSVAARMSRLPGGTLAVVPTDAVTPAVRTVLERTNALHPVYRSGSTRIVAYPEVRVHVGDEKRGQLLSAVNASGVPADIVGEDHGEIVLRPRSGRGADAVALANSLYEGIQPEMSQPRLVRLVPKPDTRR